jgi:hypothetical protein
MENHIARGEVAWIALVPKLAAGADGAAAEDLGIDLAEALPNNPLAVLRVIDVQDRSPILGPSRVCGIPFIEPQPGVVDRNRRKALTAVSAVRGGRLFKVRQDCLSALRQGSDRRGDLAARSPRH